MTCHDSSPNYIPVGINYNNVTGKATGLAEIRTLDVAEIRPVDGSLVISGTQIEIKTTNLILSSDVDVFIPGNLTVSGNIIGETTPVNLDAYITSSTFNPFSATVTSHIGTTDIHFTSGGLVAYTDTIYPALTDYNAHIGSGSVHYTSGALVAYTDTLYPTLTDYNAHIGSGSVHYTSGALVAYTDTIYPALTNYNSHVGSGTVHFTSGSLSGYYAASSWVDLNYTDNADFTSHTGSASVHYTSGSLSGYYAASSWVDLNYTDNSDFNAHTGSGTVHFTSGSLSGYYAASSWVDANYTDNSDFNAHTGSGSVHFTSGSLSSYYAVSTVVDSRLSGKQNQDPTLDAIANITTGASTLIYFSGNDLAATTTLSDFARNILDDSNATTVRSTIGTVIGADVQGYSTRLNELDLIGRGALPGGAQGDLAYGSIPIAKIVNGFTISGYNGLSAGPTEFGRFLRVQNTAGPFYEPFWSTFNLNEAADVADGTPGTNTFLRYDGSVWSGVSASLSGSLGDVYISSTPLPGAFLFWSDTQKAWITNYPSVGGGIPLDPDSPGLENLRNVNSSSVTPETNPFILDGDPFVWDSAASAWGHRNITNFAGGIAPELAPYFVSAGGGTYASSNYRVSSLSANNIFASASVPANVPLQVRFAPSSTTSHVLFASADGTEIARINLRGNNNLFFGFRGGNGITTTTRSTGVGHYSLEYLTTGNDNTGFGYLANYTVNTGARNTAVGSEASRNLTTANDNTSIGHQANHTLVNGAFNTAVGAGASRDASSGQGNVSVGYRALYNNQVGTGNIGIGYRAGQSFSGSIAGSNNIAIGYDSNQSGSNSYSNTITIGSGITSTASNETIIGHSQTSSTIIRGAVSAASYVNAPTTSGTFSTGDVLYYNGTVWVRLARPALPAVLLVDNSTPTEGGLPYWLEAPTTTPSTTFALKVDTDGSNNPGAIYWGSV